MKKTILLATALCAIAPMVHAQYAQPAYTNRPTYMQPVYTHTQQPAYAQQQVQRPQAQVYQAQKYKVANPMYQLRQGQFMSDTTGQYINVPRDKDLGTERISGWAAQQQFSYGLTDRLSVSVAADIGELKGDESKDKLKEYGATVGLKYHLVKTDFFDMNMGIDGRIFKQDLKIKGLGSEDVRYSYVSPYVTLGAKVENVTPYIRLAYVSSLWSEEDAGSYYVARPGIYIDANPYLGFDFYLENTENTATTYGMSADFYASQNVVVSLQGSVVAPEEDGDVYTVGANVKFVF